MNDEFDDASRAVVDAHQREWAFVLAATVRVAGDIDLAEECVQDAYVAALDAWRRNGVPRNPAAWLTTTARNRALDAHRRNAVLRRKLPQLADQTEDTPPEFVQIEDDIDTIEDDRLRLVFTCCHPALGREAQVALTLRLICGLTTAEIAQAFLVPEPTMAARVTRAKKKISTAKIPYRVPEIAELPDRLDAVLTVVHLLFTTGHTAPAGAQLVRVDLVAMATSLARMLHALMPDEREVCGLLGLILLTDARRDTRVALDGRLLLLEEQDRSRWNRELIDEGSALVVRALSGGAVGRFAIQAAIAAVHAEAPSYAETDWVTAARSLRHVAPHLAFARRRAQPMRGSTDGARTRGRFGRGRSTSRRQDSWPAIGIYRRRGPTCYDGWTASVTPRPPTDKR